MSNDLQTYIEKKRQAEILKKELEKLEQSEELKKEKQLNDDFEELCKKYELTGEEIAIRVGVMKPPKPVPQYLIPGDKESNDITIESRSINQDKTFKAFVTALHNTKFKDFVEKHGRNGRYGKRIGSTKIEIENGEPKEKLFMDELRKITEKEEFQKLFQAELKKLG